MSLDFSNNFFSSILPTIFGSRNGNGGPSVPPVPGSEFPRKGPDGIYRMPDGTPTTPPFLPNPNPNAQQPSQAPARPKSPLAQFTDPNTVLSAIANGGQSPQQQQQPPTKFDSAMQILFGGQIPQRPVQPTDPKQVFGSGPNWKSTPAGEIDSAGNPLPRRYNTDDVDEEDLSRSN